MFSRIRQLIAGTAAPAADSHKYRLSTYSAELEAPEYTFEDDEADRVDVHAFGRDFVPEGEPGSDEGYVLLTNGMSDRRMTLPAGGIGDDGKPRAELMWYVREPTPELVANLRWLAKLPFMDTFWLGSGHRVPMPSAPVTGCDFKTFLFLTPIIGSDQNIAETLSIDGDPVEILTVHLISDAEYQLVKQTDGLNAFLDMLDEKDYPLIFDPARKSYV